VADDEPKVEDTETPAAEAEAAPKKPARRSRAKKADAPEAAAAAESADEETTEEKPKRARRSRAKKAEPVAEEATADETPEAEEPQAADAPDDDEPPAKATPTPRVTPLPTDGRVPVVRAQAKYVRTSARKARLVCDHIRGKSVDEARAILAHTPRHVARDWTKLLESAVANAEHNHELIGDDLRIAFVSADEGPTLKRFRPRAMGRATPIRKRTSHLTIGLTPKEY
jgi:large subunit ribosomal protein L22